jgi:hypothetical protein
LPFFALRIADTRFTASPNHFVSPFLRRLLLKLVNHTLVIDSSS